MKKTLAVLILSVQIVSAQNMAQKLDKATKDLMDSSGAVASSLSFYVSDENGNFIYEYQGSKGLSTASTQKNIYSKCSFRNIREKLYLYHYIKLFRKHIRRKSERESLHQLQWRSYSGKLEV